METGKHLGARSPEKQAEVEEREREALAQAKQALSCVESGTDVEKNQELFRKWIKEVSTAKNAAVKRQLKALFNIAKRRKCQG